MAANGCVRKDSPDLGNLAATIKAWAREIGFQAVGIADTDLAAAEPRFSAWLAQEFDGELNYMRRHGQKRVRPELLVPGTIRVISVRMDYRPDAADGAKILNDSEKAFVARYALGRDYHKVLRGRLQRLAARIENEVGDFGYRVFTDSAPVMEVELARKAGIGWRGKNTLLLARDAGSYFFLGEIFTDLPLPVDQPISEHCGSCNKCIDVCPTRAIVAPYVVDARRCISYLTIELKGSIPTAFREMIGNRVYGCDDCQIVCPWNRYARLTNEDDFRVRHGLDSAELAELFAWSESQFLRRTAGSAIRRIGYERWLRNLAVGLGNASATKRVIAALRSRAQDRSELVREHVAWALARHGARRFAAGAMDASP
jgi:epoxyqueuosine reductase